MEFDDDEEGLRLSRIERRRSLSLSTGLDWLEAYERRIGVEDEPQETDRLTEEQDPVVKGREEKCRVKLSEIDDTTDASEAESIEDKNEKRRTRRVGVVAGPAKERNGKPSSLATRRKSGIAPLNISNSNFNKRGSPGPETPTTLTARLQGTITAAKNFVPKVFQTKPKDYKLQVFVAFLFLVITFSVGYIYIAHHEKKLKESYYERISFSRTNYRFRLKNSGNKEVLTGYLGTGLSKNDKAWPCLGKDLKEDSSCLEWMGKARLYFHPVSLFSNENSILECFEVFWESLSPKFPLKDCFDIDYINGEYYYGGGELKNNHWTLDNRTQVPYVPFLTGNKVSGDIERKEGKFQWGKTLKRYFMNSRGAGIQINDTSPLLVSINENNDASLCIGIDENKWNEKFKVMPMLNYTICSASNVLTLSERLAERDILKDVSREDFEMVKSFIEAPVWRVLPRVLKQKYESERALLNHSEKISLLPEHISDGIILLDEHWQKYIGDLEMDPERFPTMSETLDTMGRRGFKIALSVGPYFSIQSQNYREGLNVSGVNIWTVEKESSSMPSQKRKVPALTNYKEWKSVAVLDVTRREARSWLKSKLEYLVSKYSFSSFYVDLGSTYDFPLYHEFSSNLPSTDHYKDLFLQVIHSIRGVETIGVSSAIMRPKLPTFVSLSEIESSWEGLASLIPNILTLGIVGYPFVMPGPIGGEYFSAMQLEAYKKRKNRFMDPKLRASEQLPDRDLYIRWLQLVHFLPVVQYGVLPSSYDEGVVEIANEMSKIRKNKLGPHLKKAIDESATTGLPIIRPLWMIDPTDSNCFKVSDQFTIGDNVIVAPVINPNSTTRDVYLPRGQWTNEIDEISSKGEKWVHNFRVKQSQILFYTRDRRAL